jgi:hypothetical protein
MQIFELTQPVNEIDWGATAKAVGNRILQAPVRALGQRVGQDLLPPDDTKTITQRAGDIGRYFDIALTMLERRNGIETTIARLINKHGATNQQAMNAVDAALDNISQRLDTVQNQKNTAKPVQTSTGAQQPATKSAVPTPITPEQLRIAKQRAAAVRADIEAMPVALAATPLSQMSPEQQRIMKQKFAGSMARAQMSGSPKPAPANYGTNVGPAVKPQMTATPTLNVPVTKTNLPAPSNVVPIKPGMMPAPTAAVAPAKQEPISIGGQKIKPGDPLYDKLQKQIAQKNPTAVAESLTWSRGFDPSATLLKKIKPL